MDEVDRILDALKVHIKKEIVDNYFADRVYLEEDTELLHQEVQDYAQEHGHSAQAFHGPVLCFGLQGSLRPDDGRSEARALAVLPGILQPVGPGTAGTAQRLPPPRLHRLPPLPQPDLDLYDRLHQESVTLGEAYAKLQTHLKLLNEDINKFNLSYDFGLIAAQIEALDGGRDESMCGGLLAPEREELSTRMRFQAPEADGRGTAAGGGPAAPEGDPEKAG